MKDNTIDRIQSFPKEIIEYYAICLRERIEMEIIASGGAFCIGMSTDQYPRLKE